jgi:hypothetical protein
VSAQSVSFFGYGQTHGASEDRVLRVEAERLQVSAPTGVAARGYNANGLFYRLMDRGQSYAQLQVLGTQSPERVVIAPNEIAGQPAQAAAFLALGAAPTAGFAQQMQSMVWPSSSAPAASSRAMAFLAAPVQATADMPSLGDKLQQGWILLNDLVADDEDLLSDLAYGFSGPTEPSFVMGLPAVQPASSGLLPVQEPLFDYLVDPQ